MNKELAMLRAYPKEEIVDMLIDESKELLMEEVERKRSMLTLQALLKKDDTTLEMAKSFDFDTMCEQLRETFAQAPKSSAVFFLYKMRDALRNGITEKFDPEEIMRSGEPKQEFNASEVKRIQRQMYATQPSDHIYMSIRESKRLKELWETQKNIKAANVPSDIFFSDEIAIRDLIITITNDHRIDSRKFKTTRNIRIAIFDSLPIPPEKPDDPFVIGALSVEVVIDPMPKSVSMPHFVTPLLVQPGFNGIGIGDTYSVDNRKLEPFANITPDGRTIASKELIWEDIENYLKIWYGIQLALLHPIIQDVFKHPSTEKIAHEEPKKGGKTRTVYTYIKKHVIQPHDFDPPAPKEGDDNKAPRTWSTLLWHVTGHWRHYKDGRTAFVKPYWKGPLRSIKQPVEPRIRRIAIPPGLPEKRL